MLCCLSPAETGPEVGSAPLTLTSQLCSPTQLGTLAVCCCRCCRYTRDVKATPDVWLRDLAKAPVLQMQADLRLIRSRVFFTNNSVRFPRIAGER